MTLRLATAHANLMFAHARRAYPEEACGMRSACEGGGYLLPMKNVAADPRAGFEFDHGEIAAVAQLCEDTGQTIDAVYHSHASGIANPSFTDHHFFRDPEIHYVIVGSLSGALKSWRVVGGELHEEDLVIE